MPESSDDFRRLRSRAIESEDELDRYREDGGTETFKRPAVTVDAGHYPAEASDPNVFFAVAFLVLGGDEYEGASGAILSGTPGPNALHRYALNIGNAVPPAGTRVDVYYSPHRYCFCYRKEAVPEE